MDWETKEQPSNYHKPSKSEDKLYDLLLSKGLRPERQYLISNHRVDFAFPKEKLIVEVDGKHHRTPEEISRDEKRRDVAENLGWSVKRFPAETVWNNTEDVVKRITSLLNWNSSFKRFNKLDLNLSNKHDLKSRSNKTSPQKSRFKKYKPKSKDKILNEEIRGLETELARQKAIHQEKSLDLNKMPYIQRVNRKSFKAILILIFISLIFLVFFIINNKDLIYEKNIEALNTVPNSIQPLTPEPAQPLIVEGSSTDVIITNNENKKAIVNVTYRIYSRWFGADYNENKLFEVSPNSQQSFRVYDNVGCSSAPC